MSRIVVFNADNSYYLFANDEIFVKIDIPLYTISQFYVIMKSVRIVNIISLGGNEKCH